MLYLSTYEIKNEILKNEIDIFINKHKKNEDRVLSLFIDFDKESRNLIYYIDYKTDFSFFDIKESKLYRSDNPDIVTKYKNEYLFIYLGYPNDIFINSEILFEIGKLCFPKHYKLYLEGVEVITTNHQEHHKLELIFENNKKLIDKREYDE